MTRLLNIDEAAEYLGITPRGMRELWRSHRVTGIKVGRLVRFRPSDLERFCAENTIEAVG